MGFEEFSGTYGLVLSDDQARDYIKMMFEFYNMKKKDGDLYYDGDKIPINIISLYVNYIKKRDFNLIYDDYKNKFILNESLVEPGVTPEEKDGLSKVYDYISDFSLDKVNIFIESFKIHNLLYSCCPHPEFANKIREDDVFLYDTPYDVVSAKEALKRFNTYVTKNVRYDPNSIEIFDYIDECVKLTTELIKLQPYSDGNKRTFRAVLNLLLKLAGIPPIYIKQEERSVYKKELLKAICDNDYKGLNMFYYYKIADSIVSLDIYDKDKQEVYSSKKTK